MARGVRALALVSLLGAALTAAPAHAQSLTLRADHPEKGWIRTADTIEDLATRMQDVDKAQLLKTVAEFKVITNNFSAEYGGTSGYGTVFKLDTSGNETVLHSFTNSADGGYPSTQL